MNRRPPNLRDPNLREKLGSALLMLIGPDGKPLVDRERAKTMTAKQIIGLFEFDHGIHASIGGSNHPTNLTPRLYADHREKTNTKDIPQIATTKRIAAEHKEFTARIATRHGSEGDHVEPRSVAVNPEKPKFKWASRRLTGGAPMPGTRASGVKKTMAGKTVRR